ncbi:MAG: Rpn family recombination-promoting nuclease/putative transposase [Bariatricus sp.]|nr:Rpn family recombination-promoting nuclease/putative transposase [Bariatricus sp.]
MPSPKITWLTTHREAKQCSSTSGKYLTGFYKDDRLIPVITVVVYFGSDTWNAPRSLHEMLSVQDPEILSLVPDYRINLFSPAEIKDEELDKLESNLKEVMLFIKYSKDKRKLQELTSQDPSFSPEDISRFSGLPLEDVLKLREK